MEKRRERRPKILGVQSFKASDSWTFCKEVNITNGQTWSILGAEFKGPESLEWEDVHFSRRYGKAIKHRLFRGINLNAPKHYVGCKNSA